MNKREHIANTEQNTKIQYIIYAKKKVKTSKNNPVKTHHAKPIYPSALGTRNTKKKHPKTHTNSKTSQPKPKQENK